MRVQPNFLSFINISFYTTIILFVYTGCNYNRENPEQQNKDTAQAINETRFGDSAGINNAGFLSQAAWTNSHEIAIGQLGKDKSQTPEILVLAKMLIQDHTASAEELKTIADKKNIVLPVYVDKNQDEGINNLVNKDKATFDRAFVDVVIQSHKEAIEKFETAEAGIIDTDIKGYMHAMLSDMKKHLEKAEETEKGIK